MTRDQGKRVLLKLLVELVVYGLLLLVYFVLVLRFLGDPLQTTSKDNIWLYALAGLGLMVAQAVLLDIITSFLVERLDIERLR